MAERRFTTDLTSYLYPTAGHIEPPPLSDASRQRLAELEEQIEQDIQEYSGEAGIRYFKNPFYLDMRTLPSELRESYARQVEELRGFSEVLDKGGPAWIKPPGQVSRPFGRYQVDLNTLKDQSRVDENTLFWMTHYVQHQGRAPIGRLNAEGLWEGLETPAQMYGISGRMIRPSLLSQMTADVLNPPSIGGNYAVVDLETAGLDPGIHGIWQGTVRTYDAEGKEVTQANHYFEQSYMNLGRVGRKALTPKELVESERQIKYSKEVPGLTDIIQRLMSADKVVGHNVMFDINFLMERLHGHVAYGKDANFTEKVNQFVESMSAPGKLVDTSILSRIGLNDIPIDPELQKFNIRATPHSLQNILLQTNLIPEMEKDLGKESVQGMVRKGLHYSDVDTYFENYLYRYTRQGRIKTTPLKDESLAAAIRSSHALTPTIAFTNWGEIHPEVAEKMRAAGMVPGQLNPLEQDILLSRRFIETQGPADFGDINHWQRFSGSFATETGGLLTNPKLPSPAATKSFQDTLAAKNIPHAGLTPIERMVNTTLSRGTQGSVVEDQVRRIFGGLLPDLKAETNTRLFVAGRKGKIGVLPFEVLQEAEVGGQYPEVGLSPFVSQGHHFVGLQYAPTSEDQEKIVSYLEGNANELTARWGVKGPVLDDLISTIKATGSSGISVGRMRISKEAFKSVEAIQGRVEDWTDQTVRFAANVLGIKEGGQLSLGAARLNTPFETDAEKLSFLHEDIRLKEENDRALKMPEAERQSKIMMRDRQVRNLGAEADRNDQDTNRLSQWLWKKLIGVDQEGTIKASQRAVRGKLGPVLGGAAVLGGGYYIHKKRQEHPYEHTMALQPISDQGWYDQYQEGLDSLIPPDALSYQGHPSPLSTANIPWILDQNKTRHTMMGPAKYGYLFSGGYN